MTRIEQKDFPEKAIGKLIIIRRFTEKNNVVADVVMVVGKNEDGTCVYEYKTGDKAGGQFAARYNFGKMLKVFEREEMDQALADRDDLNNEKITEPDMKFGWRMPI